MPNFKIFIDQSVGQPRILALQAQLGVIRALLCSKLAVPPSGCQLAVVPVLGLAEQPLANAELLYLRRPERTQTLIAELCQDLRRLIEEPLGLSPAVRAMIIEPENFVGLK